jgi:hypothetical protein
MVTLEEASKANTKATVDGLSLGFMVGCSFMTYLHTK